MTGIVRDMPVLGHIPIAHCRAQIIEPDHGEPRDTGLAPRVFAKLGADRLHRGKRGAIEAQRRAGNRDVIAASLQAFQKTAPVGNVLQRPDHGGDVEMLIGDFGGEAGTGKGGSAERAVPFVLDNSVVKHPERTGEGGVVLTASPADIENTARPGFEKPIQGDVFGAERGVSMTPPADKAPERNSRRAPYPFRQRPGMLGPYVASEGIGTDGVTGKEIRTLRNFADRASSGVEPLHEIADSAPVRNDLQVRRAA